MFRITEISELFTQLKETLDSQVYSNQLTLDGSVQQVREVTDHIARSFIEDYLEGLDEVLRESNERKRHYTIEKRSQEKTVATNVGPVTYQRTYFQHKRDGHYACLLDEKMGIEPHQRVSLELAVSMLESARDTSYQKTAERFAYTGVQSRTTVMNCVHHMGMIESSEHPIPTRKVMPVLYVEADEDHVAMQDNTNQQMKLIYVHEGYQPVGKKRNALINPHYFTGLYSKSSDELWYEVLTYLDTAYDLDQVEEINLSGDGASWIKMGKDILPKCRFHLDKYHLQKAMRKATSPVDELKGTEDEYYWHLSDAIELDEKETVEAYFESTIGLGLRESQIKAIGESQTYILSNWEAIQNSYRPGYPGCSAEGHISHVLSDRLSSRPLGWSRQGAEDIARLRVFALNSGNLRDYYTEKSRRKQKESRMVKLEKRLLKNKKLPYQIKQGTINYVTRHFDWYKSL